MMFDPKTTRIAAAKKLGFDEHFYGLGEKAARLDKRRGHFTMWNSDTPGYSEGTDPIYQTIPFYIGWQNGEAYGIFFDNSYRTQFDLGQSSQEYAAFSADGGELNYYFFWGPSIKRILGRYSDLTGYMPLPPMWALGNQQSRWSYYPQSVAEELVRQYRAHDLPLDVLYLDIHYMQGYRLFTWDTSRYPNPKAFTQNLRQQGVKVVTIVDPGVKYQKTEPGVDTTTRTANPELAPQEIRATMCLIRDSRRTIFSSANQASYTSAKYGRARAYSQTTRSRLLVDGGETCIALLLITVLPESGTI